MSLYAGGRDRGEFQLENYMSKVCWSVLCCCCGGRPPLNGNTREYMYIAELHGYITGRISIFTSHRRCSPRPVDKPLPPLSSGLLLNSEPGIGLQSKTQFGPFVREGLCPGHGRTREYGVHQLWQPAPELRIPPCYTVGGLLRATFRVEEPMRLSVPTTKNMVTVSDAVTRNVA